MERRFNRNLSNESKSSGSVSLQKKLAESRRQISRPEPEPDHAPDLTDFMNDMFFGTVSAEKKAYNLTGGDLRDNVDHEEEEEDFDSSVRSNSSRLTQEWLEEAKRMVASSPSQRDSPSRLAGSPRFASSQGRSPASSLLDRRDPFSRSARRQRAPERSFSGEILLKSAKNNRSNSGTFEQPPLDAAVPDASPASAVQKWLSSVLIPPNQTLAPPPPGDDDHPSAEQSSTLPPFPHVPSATTPRKSRFQNSASGATQPQGIPTHHSKRTFKNAPAPETQLLSPPKKLIESAHRRSISSSTCSLPENQVLSPPRNLVESAHRRSISSSTCSTGKISRKPSVNGWPKEAAHCGESDLNGFLKEQRIKIGKILNGEMKGMAKIVLSGPSNSTSSMVAAICYAWLSENKMKTKTNNVSVEADEGTASVVVPVMNMRRGKMSRQRQVAWLFHHVQLDATSLLFSDEVDLETLMMSKKLSILVVGQDILRTNGEVGSQCTILTDNYCEEAYDLLQNPVIKKLMLAGILLDTQNLKMSGKLCMTRDAEAVQLLSVGSIPNFQNSFYDQLMQDQRDGSFLEALRHNYGKPPNEGRRESGAPMEHKIQERKLNDEAVIQNSDKNSNDVKIAKTNMMSKSAKPKSVPVQAPAAVPPRAADASRGKNTFFLAKWFGFGPK